MFCYKYPHPAVTVDCVVFCEEKENTFVLLVKRGNEPYKDYWALPGGFIEMDESAEEAVGREVEEETGLHLEGARQLKAYTSPDRDPRERIISIAFTAFAVMQPVKGGDDASEARWFPINELPPLAFDHSQIIKDGIQNRFKS